MERFVHNANIEHYRRLIAESEFDPSRDEDLCPPPKPTKTVK
jgi:hypothetical protein